MMRTLKTATTMGLKLQHGDYFSSRDRNWAGFVALTNKLRTWTVHTSAHVKARLENPRPTLVGTHPEREMAFWV
jgi:hypothetical protein